MLALPSAAVVAVAGVQFVDGPSSSGDGGVTLTGDAPSAVAPSAVAPPAGTAGTADTARATIPTPTPRTRTTGAVGTSTRQGADHLPGQHPGRQPGRSGPLGTVRGSSEPQRAPAGDAPAAVRHAREPALPVTPTPTKNPASTKAFTTLSGSARVGGSFALQVVALTNQQRQRGGCEALTVDATLTSVAQAHSEDMARRDFFDHVNPDGASPFDRMTAARYRYRMAAENIAAGQLTPAQVVDGWMNSAGHRANILNCGLTEIGVGYATGGSHGTYWTQDFGTPMA